MVSWIPDEVACIRWGGPSMTFPLSAAGLPAMLAVENGQGFTLADGGLPLAFGQFWITTPGSVHLGRILVAPSARGRGIGTVLCRQLMARGIEETGASCVTLRVYPDNAAAIALYSGLGFEPDRALCTHELLFMRMPAPVGRVDVEC